MVEKCQPGDVVLFDRRCDACASGPIAAFGCVLGKAFLCEEEDGTRTVEEGRYEHCGEVFFFPALYERSLLVHFSPLLRENSSFRGERARHVVSAYATSLRLAET
jgi:hypothetical protein